jgi:hypothetical protein
MKIDLLLYEQKIEVDLEDKGMVMSTLNGLVNDSEMYYSKEDPDYGVKYAPNRTALNKLFEAILNK